jgi:hypothetical protein
MENDIKMRVQRAMKELEISVNALSNFRQLTRSTVNDQINGASKIGASTLEALLEYRPDLSAEWLLRGVGDMLTTTQTANGNAAPIYQNNGNGGNNVTQTVANAEIADRLLSRLEISQDQLSESLSQNKQLISIISKLTDK